MHSPSFLSLRVLSVIGLAAAPLFSCDCEDIGDLSALGAIQPASYDFGLVVSGEQCVAELTLSNDGQADLAVNESKFIDANGDFSISGIVPAYVGAFGSDIVSVAYTAGSPGAAEGATLWLKTNTPENDGVVQAALRGTPVSALSAMVQAACEVDGQETKPCAEINFGATVVADTNPGVIRSLRIYNDGTSEMQVLNPATSGNPFGNSDFSLDLVRMPSGDGMGSMLTITDDMWPITLEPGFGQCGVGSENEKTFVEFSVHYQPTEIGGDAGTFHVDTTAAIEPSSLDISLVGVGSGDGIGVDPDILRFGEVAVGNEAEKTARVYNQRLDEARVNNSCLDLDMDDVCDVDCTAIDTAVELSCGVERMDGSHEGKGFVLAPADAIAGGDDERNVVVRWAPESAGNLRAQLLLETALGGGRVWTVLITGGVSGTFSPSMDPVVVPASGDPLAGSVNFSVSNTGQAPLTISAIHFSGSGAITSEFTLTSSSDSNFTVNGDTEWTGSMLINQGASLPFTLDYQNGEVVNCDDFDIHWSHDGSGQDPFIQSVQVDGDNCQ